MQPDANKTENAQPETATQVRQREVAETAKRKLQTTVEIRQALHLHGCFRTGAHLIVDGQFGSTGKGLMASIYAEAGGTAIDMVTTNAGPNSGHTAYSPIDGTRIVTRQIPVASVVLRLLLGPQAGCFLNAGAIIDPDVLLSELEQWRIGAPYFGIHPNAALIEDKDKAAEADPNSGPALIASTGKGVGSALARKIMREGNVAVNRHDLRWAMQDPALTQMVTRATVLVETAQGFSLGVNGQFYPHTTSRECTTLQALADARIPHHFARSVIACYRTLPIRVGNTPVGNSGSHYYDQHELAWDKLGIEPELTTVTQRPRRIFTWSRIQFRESVAVNRPTIIFLNFCNYLEERAIGQLLDWISTDYRMAMDTTVSPLILLGYGPHNGDVRVL